ncbi:MAG TPA: 1-(5-phosphoribosyl)-5-[(5-phosphoribosylamino)methylideneamino]imidazole-4-carboxamide isomerase [Steroidobacteraceae bacterium]
MRLIPAIDLKGGRCVRLLKGDFSQETRYAADPLALRDEYARVGADWLHVVDLDGAQAGEAGNREIIAELARVSRPALQVGGGLRSRAAIETAFDAGVARVVIGSAAVSQPNAVQAWIKDFGAERVMLALDVRFDKGVPKVAISGWQEQSARSLWDITEDYLAYGLRHVLCTDIDRDGALTGPNLELYAEAALRFPSIEWQASGGVRDVLDLAALSATGVSAAVSGKALLEQRLRPEELRPFLPNA